jgi:predicted RecB family nuclease
MEVKITNKTIIAYSQCPRKGFFAISGEASASKCDYCTIVNAKRSTNREKHLGSKHFLAQYGGEIKQIFKSEKCIAYCDFVYSSNSSSGAIPLIFSGTRQILMENKIELAFIGFVYSKIFKVAPRYGMVITFDGKAIRINLSQYYKKIKEIVEKLLTYENTAVKLPPGLRNRHCTCCDYRVQCEKINRDSASISSLSCITPLLYKKLGAKGITTIEQLSYQYRPRRRKKKKNPRTKAPFQPALQALALTENKVYVRVPPETLQITNCIILDFEGQPDESTYYLIGIILFQNGEKGRFSYWANTAKEEYDIWRQFLIEIRQNPEIPIYHYGSYDWVAVKCLAERYSENADDILLRMINVNSLIYGKIYFPTYSNGLKELAGFLGVKWSSSEATGQQSLVWRHNWVSTRLEKYKEALLKYNMEDCQALMSLIQFLSGVSSQDIQQQINFLDRPFMQSTARGAKAHELFTNILKSAHSDFSKKKVRLKDTIGSQTLPEPSQLINRKIYNPKPNRVVQLHPRRKCPKCGYPKAKISNRPASLIISDISFTKQGGKRFITHYKSFKIYCCKCNEYYNPNAIANFGRGRRYGEGLMSWTVHQRIVYRLPFHTIAQSTEELFNIPVGAATIEAFIEYFADKHGLTVVGNQQCTENGNWEYTENGNKNTQLLQR